MRTLAAGAIVVLVAFVTVQAGGCGFKTPLQLPNKAAPAKPAS
jgi:predicted small lipoprotein YifL